MGLLEANIDALQWGCLCLGQPQWFLELYQGQIINSTSISLQIPHKAQTSVLWRMSCSNLSQGRVYCTAVEEGFIMDTSLLGCSTTLWGLPAQGRWSSHEMKLPINILIIRLIHLASRCFASKILDHHVLVRTDRIVAKFCLNNWGGSRSSGLL